MKKLVYEIDGKAISVSVEGRFEKGEDEVLSNEQSDIAFHQPWYQQGFSVQKFFPADEFAEIKKGITEAVQRIIEHEQGAPCAEFSLEKYHHHISDDEMHFKVVRQTRDLFPGDFKLNVHEIHQKLSDLVQIPLSDIDPRTKRQLHIIVRINRPGSNDFNPPHKDAYEAFDGALEGYDRGEVPPFINFWIPIAGVTPKTSLPLAPASHLIPESEVLRTRSGAQVEGNQYRVRMVAEWGGSTSFERAKVGDGDLLMFSGFLIHGLAKNEEVDTTRVALEFRLYADRD